MPFILFDLESLNCMNCSVRFDSIRFNSIRVGRASESDVRMRYERIRDWVRTVRTFRSGIDWLTTLSRVESIRVESLSRMMKNGCESMAG